MTRDLQLCEPLQPLKHYIDLCPHSPFKKNLDMSYPNQTFSFPISITFNNIN